MAFTLLQVGSGLKSINGTGQLSSTLTLPSGVILATNLTPRFAKFKNYVVVVNTPTRPISVDVDGVVRVLTPTAPASAIILSAGASGALSGTYLSLQTYKLLDASGNVIAESDYGPAMAAPWTIASKKLHAAFAISADAVDATQLYRTTTNGATYFSWARVDGNTLTSYEDDAADASLGIVEGAPLGAAPDLTLIAEWAGRLWGVDRSDVDDLRFTEAGTMYAWSALNTIPIPHIGADAAGITALIPRRNALGVARRDTFVQVTGTQLANFTPITVSGGEQMGCVSQESVVVLNDVAYFLWRDGVYQWDSNGITSITNGQVRSWFTSDTYFNRAMFWRAFAQLDPIRLKYRLFLASTGNIVHDRWVEFDLLTRTWWGPHKTAAFSPSCAVQVQGVNQQPYFMIGSREGYLSQEQADKNDWGAPIETIVVTRSQDMDEPDYRKYFGELSMIGKVQPSGTISVTPTVGDLDATPSAPMTYDMTVGRDRLARIGEGLVMSLELTHNTVNEDIELYGYEVNPVTMVGRR